MGMYGYLAIDNKGKERKGSLTADSLEKAISQIKTSGMVPVNVSEQSIATRDIDFAFLQKKPKARDMSVFCRQFVSILDAGVPVVSALEMLAEQTDNKLLSKTTYKVKQAVERGDSLTDAMRAHVRVFGDMFVTLVEAGEASGSLSNSFERMASQFEKDSHIRSLVKKATIYPTVVLIVAIAVVIAMLTFVIPSFEDMFQQLGTELPGITKAVVAASEFLQSWWYIVLAVVIALVLGVRWYKNTVSGQILFGSIGMKLPLFGKLIIKSASSRFARTMSTLMSAGLPLIDALEITGNTMTNYHFKKALRRVRDGVISGTGLAEPLAGSGVFPAMVCHMVKIGEETGNVEEMLDKLADYYDEEVEDVTQQLMAALEPMIIILLAVVVGVIILAVMLPMMNMYEGLDNL